MYVPVSRYGYSIRYANRSLTMPRHQIKLLATWTIALMIFASAPCMAKAVSDAQDGTGAYVTSNYRNMFAEDLLSPKSS